MRSKQTLRATGLGIGVAILGGLAIGFAIWSRNTGPRLAAALLLTPLFVDYLLTPNLRGLIARVGPRRGQAGASFLETLEIDNSGRHRVEDVVVREPGTATWRAQSLIKSLAAEHRCILRLLGRAKRRGHFAQRRFVFETGWPLDLFRRRLALEIDGDLVVEPSRRPLATEVIRSLESDELAHEATLRRYGDEFHALREYRDGDSARFVHALRSASLGTLVLQERRGQDPAKVGLVLDLRGIAGRFAQARFEHALSLCASALDLCRKRRVFVKAVVLQQNARLVALEAPRDYEDFGTFLAELELPTSSPESDEDDIELPEAPTRAWSEIDHDGAFEELNECRRCLWVHCGASAEPRLPTELDLEIVVVKEFEA